MSSPIANLKYQTGELERRRGYAEDARQAWVLAIADAVDEGWTLETIAEAAGVSRQRIGQIVGATGRTPGRQPQSTERKA